MSRARKRRAVIQRLRFEQKTDSYLDTTDRRCHRLRRWAWWKIPFSGS